MKMIKNIMQESFGFRFMIDELKIMSSSGKKQLLNQPLSTSEAAIEKEIALVAQMIQFLENKENAPVFGDLSHKFAQLRDIHGALASLASGLALDDIDLFEIKHFAIVSGQMASILQGIGCALLEIPALEEVVAILDPDQQKIPQFYIYSSYSPELGDVRARMRGGEMLKHEEQDLEDQIRVDLSARLLPYSDRLHAALEILSHLDIIIAKAAQAIAMRLCRPQISRIKTSYDALFNPAIQALLEKEKKTYQPVDIELREGPVLITGANMGGKTVLLKTLFLAQYLFQFGFFVPAQNAEIMPVEEIMLSSGDNQPERQGLSSFAYEMTAVNNIIAAIRSGKKTLALIDELARTTNPDEGKAIVNAVLDLLGEYRVCSVVTTHYSNIESDCRKLRVKGLKTEGMEGTMRFERLNELMDYRLMEADGAGPVSEGIRIAEILGVDGDLIEKAKGYFKKENKR